MSILIENKVNNEREKITRLAVAVQIFLRSVLFEQNRVQSSPPCFLNNPALVKDVVMADEIIE